MKTFKLTDIQAEAILEIRLRQLAKLEREKLEQEHRDLSAEAADLEKILKSAARLKTLLKKELTADAERYGDPRRSQLTEAAAPAQAMDLAELSPSEPVHHRAVAKRPGPFRQRS